VKKDFEGTSYSKRSSFDSNSRVKEDESEDRIVASSDSVVESSRTHYRCSVAVERIAVDAEGRKNCTEEDRGFASRRHKGFDIAVVRTLERLVGNS